MDVIRQRKVGQWTDIFTGFNPQQVFKTNLFVNLRKLYLSTNKTDCLLTIQKKKTDKSGV